MTRRRAFKLLVFAACAAPFVWLVWAALTGRLSANVIDDITDHTGRWTLRLVLATLAITPLRRLTGWNILQSVRRMVGLSAFFYGCLHFSTYLVLDQFFDVELIWADVAKRPFITAGFTAFVLMIPLAVTSTKWMIRRLGRRWQTLHRLVYVCALAGVVHYFWLVKIDIRPPLGYAAVAAALLAARAAHCLGWWPPKTRAARGVSSAPAGQAG